MKVEFQDSFLKKVNRQVAFIARDKPGAARKFKKELTAKCKDLATQPYKYRKSIYFEREDIRDMTFKGYTIVYKVDKNIISVFAFLKYEDGIK